MVCFECDARPGDPLDAGARWLIILRRGSELWFGATAEDAEIERRCRGNLLGWKQKDLLRHILSEFLGRVTNSNHQRFPFPIG